MTLYNIIQENLDKINWWNLSANPNAIPFLEKNIDKIKWWLLSENPKPLLFGIPFF